MPRRIPDIPPSLDEFPGWVFLYHDIVLDDGTEKEYYESTAEKIKDQFEAGPFWTDVCSKLAGWNDLYYQQHQFLLFANSRPPELTTKSYDSVINKSYRVNITGNDSFPEPPDKEWVLPETWLTRFDDIVRMTFIVEYLDGLDWLSEQFESVADTHGMIFDFEPVARYDGYYAYHCRIRQAFSILSKDWARHDYEFDIEIQIKTRLQGAITDLLHKVYERWKLEAPPKNWQWEHDTQAFQTNYLGHVLQYLDGQVMSVRDGKQS